MIILHRKGERERIELLRFTPDGRSLFTSSYNGATLWDDLPNTNPRQVFSDYRYIRCVRFTPDGRHLLIDHNGLTIHNLADGSKRQVKLWDSYWSKFDVAFGSRHILIMETNPQTNREWIACCSLDNLALKDAIWSRELSRSLVNTPTCVAGDRFILTESWWEQSLMRGMFRYVTRSLKTGEMMMEAEGPGIGSFPPVVSPDGQLFAGLDNARVVVLSVDDFSKPIATLRNDNRKHFTGITFHPSGRYLAATSNDATVKLYDTTNWEVTRTFTWKIGRMRSIAFSPDGTLAAAGSDKGQVVVWDVDL